jgi:hypothetical protein
MYTGHGTLLRTAMNAGVAGRYTPLIGGRQLSGKVIVRRRQNKYPQMISASRGSGPYIDLTLYAPQVQVIWQFPILNRRIPKRSSLPINWRAITIAKMLRAAADQIEQICSDYEHRGG